MKKTLLIKIFCLLLVFNTSFHAIVKAQTPTKCFEIESILVDACNPTSLEPNNEMVRFKVGPSSIDINNLEVDGANSSGTIQLNAWPTVTNPFLGFIQNATTAAITAALQATVQSTCGFLIEPPAGIIPAGAEVLLITSDTVSTVDNSFAALVGTLYVIYHNEKRTDTKGHFGNFVSTAGTRTFVLRDNFLGCSDTVKYSPSLLVGGNGATVNYTWPGTPIESYVNDGCKAPFVNNTADAGLGGSICPSGSIALSGTASGNYASVIWQGGQGTFSTPNTLTTNYTANASETGILTLTLGVVGFCNDTVFDSVQVTIYPQPVMTSANAATVCSGTALNLIFSSNVPAAYSWFADDNTNTSGESLAPQTSGTLNDVITNNTTAAQTVVYHVTPTSTTGTCAGTAQTVTITVNPAPAMTSPSSAVICSGDTVIIPLTSSIPSSYSWIAIDNANTSGESLTAQTNDSLIDIITNNTASVQVVQYTVTPTSLAGNCSSTQTINVTVNPLPVISGTPLITLTSCGSSNGSITGLTAAGSPVLTYTWTNGSSAVVSTSTTTADLTGQPAGNYTLTVTSSATTCANSTGPFVIGNSGVPVPTASSSSPFCAGTALNLTASSTAPAGSTYNWIGPNGFSSNQQNITVSSSATALMAGTYSVTVTVSGCTSAAGTTTVVVTPQPSAAITPPGTTTICKGSSVTLTGSGTGTSFFWMPGNVPSSTISPAVSGTYLYIAQNGCGSDTASAVVIVDSVTAFFTADVTSGNYPLTVSFTNGSSSNAISPPMWNFGDGNTSTAVSPSNTFQTPGTYNTVLTVTNANGCTDTYSVTIIVFENPSSLQMPNVFTPNGDTKNDLFTAISLNITEFNCGIYDRWGLKITDLPNVNKGWDGRTSSGALANDGIYFYIVKAKGIDGKEYDQKGYVQLIRK